VLAPVALLLLLVLVLGVHMPPPLAALLQNASRIVLPNEPVLGVNGLGFGQ
jgi:hypothetical protein